MFQTINRWCSPGARPKRRVVGSVLVPCLLAALIPPRVEARWDDNSGNLPGISSAKSAILLGAAAGGAIVAIALLRSRNGKPKLELRFNEPAALDAAVGESRSSEVTVANPMDRPVTITRVSFRGKEFQPPMAEGSIVLQPGESTRIPVSFTPTKPGNAKGELSISARGNDLKDAQWKIPLRGRGL